MSADREKARGLAARAYHAAVRGDWPAASAAMAEAGRQNPNVIALVLCAFCDTAISLQRGMLGLPPLEDGVPAQGPVRPGWVNAETGRLTLDADQMTPAARWAGRLVAARAALDSDGFLALLKAMPADGLKRGEYANALLTGCASLAALAGETAPPPAFDAAWREVTCRDCRRTWTCTPEADYFGDADGGRPESATSGRCFGCMLTAGGMNPETTPVQVINLTGTGTADPRDLSQGKP